jgi:polyhydroxybutyrate depolymerase
MRRALAGVALLTALLACGRGTPLLTTAARDYDASLAVGGLVRTYHVHVPPIAGVGRTLPLMLSLHGRLGDGAGQARLTHFNTVADAAGFIVVSPDGYQRSWADGRGTTPADQAGVNDVAFLSAVIDQVNAREPVDATRIYAAGMSNGGFMAERLGCDLARRIAAIAVVAASFSPALAGRCAPAHPMPVLLIHGSLDPLVPEDGGLLEGEPVLSLAETAARWASLAGCATAPGVVNLPSMVDDGTTITQHTFVPCQGTARVVYDEVDGGGHTWPGGLQYLPVSVIGRTSQNLDASQMIWSFCAAYHL